jgi:hypothetical protein
MRHFLNRFGLCSCTQCADLAGHCGECMKRAARWASEVSIWVAPVVRLSLVDSDAPNCRRPGCTNLLSGRQSMFCSKTCGGAVRQRNFRDRDLIKLSATDVDLIAACLEAPKEFRREVRRAWRNAERPIDLGSGVSIDPEVLEVFRESARRP